MKYSRKWSLLRALWSGAPKNHWPAFITLDVTPHCNLTCIGCRFHSPLLRERPSGEETAPVMPLALLQRLVSDLAPQEMHYFVEGSGEPFVHPQILELLTLLKARPSLVTLFTNGTLIDAAMAERLIAIQVDVLRFSLFAAGEASFRKNYAGSDPGHFVRIQENIRRLRAARQEKAAAKPLLQLFFPVNRTNRDEVDAAIELAAACGCDGITFGRFVELGEKVAGLALDTVERKQLGRELRGKKSALKRHSLTHTIARDVVMQESGPETWQHAPCLITWFHVRIRGNGDVLPCCRCAYPLGNLHEQSFREIWHGERLREFRRRAAAPDGAAWLKEQGAQCHDCPHIPEMIKLHRIQRIVSRLRNFLPLNRAD